MSADNGYAVIRTKPPAPEGWGFVMYFASDEYIRPLEPERDTIYPTKEAAITAAFDMEQKHWSEYGVGVYDNEETP